MLHIVGNGPSRKQYDLNSFDEWWGCNGIYTDYTPDIVFCQDIPVQHQAVVDGVPSRTKLAVGDWDVMPIEDYDMLYDTYGMMGGNRFENRTEDDTHFVVQGERDEVYFTSYNIPFGDNIIMYNYDKLKNTFCGISALGYAAYQGYKEITMVGFDALDPQLNNEGNVYEGTGLLNYHDKYTKESPVFAIQRMQFVSLLEDDLFNDVKVYFKNPLDNDQEVIYNELSYYESSRDKWVLGESSLFTFR